MNFGVIGVGKMGSSHLRVLAELPSVKSIVAYDTDRARLEEVSKKYGVRTFCELESFFETVDAVVISSPTETHAELCIKAVEHGKHVLVEKPVAGSVKEAVKIQKAADKTDSKVMVGHIERFNPVIQRIKSIYESCSDDPKLVTIRRLGPFPPRNRTVGIITDLAVHDIDILRFLTGAEPSEVSCFYQTVLNEELEDTALITLAFPNGCLGQIILNWLTPFKVRTIEVASQNAYYSGDLMNQRLVRYEKYGEDGSYVSFEYPVSYQEPLKAELTAFIDCILSDGEVPVPLSEGIRNLELAERCLEDGKHIKLS